MQGPTLYPRKERHRKNTQKMGKFENGTKAIFKEKENKKSKTKMGTKMDENRE
jgi:hypothetical protein